ncbi:MAG: tRNA (guanosine(37)-N1)-methyltransferase TrmD [Clostridiales bacterium]|jgi:tRNA (guanine37-N1)-methyltransferase|nr:tRNA (guanosine(37)-N1)-methyltransferase TrmD [Clostridiales bacterium]
MVFHVLSLFPQMVAGCMDFSVIKRAVESGLVTLDCIDIRAFSSSKRSQADDAPYGGGAGMVMSAQPIVAACASAKEKSKEAPVIYLSPRGEPFTQRMAEELARESALILLCGHYEGIDERALEEIGAREVSIGDFVLTGGEIAAMAVMDSVSRLVPGVLGKEESHQFDSFSDGLLEYPQYTRPPVFMGREVPEVLLSGHHKNVDSWRRKQSLAITLKRRPDLLEKADLGKSDLKYLSELGYKKGMGSALKGIITVIGKDQMGIIARVCTFLSGEGINILDISQTIVQGYFTMMMIVDLDSVSKRFEELAESLRVLGEEIGVQAKLQHEDIFNSMHRI